jgi:hypothetical protein
MSGYDDTVRNADEIERRYRELYPLVTGTVKPAPKDEGFVKPGGWGGNTREPKTWKVVNMKDDPKLFKVIDAKKKNIAANFFTKAGAQAFIDKAIELVQEDGDTDEPDTTPDIPPVEPVTGQLGPYAAVGETLKSTRKGPTTRHYRSGKPDDKTVEQNTKGIKARNHQFITYVTMKKVEHDDTMSQKIGGRHMEEGWFVNSIEFESGLCGIGAEKKHPKTSHNDVKGGKIGSILNKKIGMASVYFADKNKVELWTDTGDRKWKKQCEGTNVVGFNPKASTFECQLRIDGFEELPDIHTAVVQEIAPQ